MAYKLEANKPYYIKVSGYNGGTQNYDPYLKLYTDESLTDRIGFHNTIVAAELTAGKTYYLQFSGYLMKYARGRITVKKGGPIAPNAVVFDYGVSPNTGVASDGKKYFNLFDDLPEFIRRCDILDDGSYEPASLSHFENLSPGIYTVFAYHHVDRRGGALAFSNGPNIYFDAVFYNTETNWGNVKINRLGYSAKDWSKLQNAWDDYNHIYNGSYSSNQYINDDPLWLSSITGNSTAIDNGSSLGYIHLMMEFEVTNGTVSFATVAYKNKTNGKNAFGSRGNGVKSKYEILETSKGMGNTSQRIEAQEMNYYINDSVRVYTTSDGLDTGNELPFEFVNPAYPTGKEQRIFGTHAGTLNDNVRWVMPESAQIPLIYNGVGINRSTGETIPSRDWIFDNTHTSYVAPFAIPSNLQSLFEGKTSFSTNENVEQTWINNIMAQDYWMQVAAFQMLGGHDGNFGAVLAPVAYEITHVLTINVHNAGSNERTISYVAQGHDIFYDVSATNTNGQTKAMIGGALQNKNPNHIQGNYTGESFSREIAKYSLNPGETIKITVQVTMLTGSNPSVCHAFFIDMTDKQRTGGNPRYGRSLFDTKLLYGYPQN